MSTKEQSAPSMGIESTSFGWNLRVLRILRLAIAATVALTIAQVFNWPLSFLAPVLVTALLVKPIPRPTMRGFLKDVVYSSLMVAGAFVLVMLVQPYPMAFILSHSLALFFVVYFMQRGAPAIPMLMGFVTLLAFAIFGNINEGLTAVIAGSMIFSTVLALLMIQLAFGLMPDPGEIEEHTPAGFQSEYSPAAARSSLITTLVIAPMVLFFVSFQLSGYLLVIIYVGLMSLAGTTSHGVYDVKKYLLATAIGATASLPFYALIVVIPQIFFFVPLALLAIILLGSRRFSDSPLADYYGSAITAFMILISSSVGPGADIDVNIVNRVGMIILAGVYAVCVLSFVEPLICRLWPLPEDASAIGSHG